MSEKECEGITRLFQASCMLAPPMAVDCVTAKGALREKLLRNPGFERKEKVRLSVREKECEGITRLLRASCTLASLITLFSLPELMNMANRTATAYNRIIIDIESRDCENPEWSNREKNECDYMNIHVTKAKPLHIPSKDTESAEEGKTSNSHVIPAIK
ncbi:hypothetical protein IEQ34_001981 [Dendrobium chrysotoxum]|uniref:Uncharacterized protein n=1 Tax=Dendrobium chrysotoxum TaxID=161865 RepID=A0AAV7H4P3_DENCH|nr:hypothetical protein IEQ34_001981 [Dendrobium chrysotoxum]